MLIIHKIAAVVIENNKFLLVRKHGKDVWTNLGGRPEEGESEEKTLIREIKEEMGCAAVIISKIGTFEAKAVFDDATVILTTYQVELQGSITFNDPELAEFRFFTEDEITKVKLPDSVRDQMLSYCVKNGLLKWKSFS